MCYKKTVEVVVDGQDKYGRTLGTVYINDMNVNEELVRNGLAWYYRYFVDDHRLDSLEQLARSEKLNIWSKPNPTPPFEYRKSSSKR